MVITLKMNSASQIQILDKAFYISFSAKLKKKSVSLLSRDTSYTNEDQ